MAQFHYLVCILYILAFMESGSAIGLGRKKHLRSRTKHLLWLSDLHADPYYGTEGQQCSLKTLNKTKENHFGTFGCDPPYALFESAVDAAADVATTLGTKRAMFTGDFVRHSQNLLPNPDVDVPEIINNVTEILDERFKKISLGSLGNDDTPENYHLNVTTNKTVNKYLLEIAGVFGLNKVFNKRTMKEYSYGGATSKVIDNSFTMLMINTVIYSSFHTPDSTDENDPFHQFQWIRNEIEKSIKKNLPVWIVGHIPPGTETYGYTQLWHAKYVENYLSIVQDKDLGPHIALQIFGHTHADEIRVIPNAPEGLGPMLIICALSPVYYNNPGFRSLSYNSRTGRPTGFELYYTDLASADQKESMTWQYGYSFPDIYNLDITNEEAMTNSGMKNLQERLLMGLEDWEQYALWYKTNYTNDLMQYGVNPAIETTLNEAQRTMARLRYVCATQVFVTELEFHACYNHTQPSLDHNELLSSNDMQKALESRDFTEYYNMKREGRTAELINHMG